MKKVLFSAVALLAFGFVNAQEKSNSGFSKGDVFVSGAFTLSSEKTGDFKTNSFEFAPKVGYFVTENIAIGGMLGYSTDKVSVPSQSATNTGFGLGAFGRYYLTPANQFSLFAEFGLDYTSYDNEYELDSSGTPVLGNSKSKETGLGLGAGMNYFVSSNFSIEAGVAVLGYSSNDNGGNGADKTNTFSFGGDWRAVTFGVNYKF